MTLFAKSLCGILLMLASAPGYAEAGAALPQAPSAVAAETAAAAGDANGDGFVDLDITDTEDIQWFFHHRKELIRFAVGFILSVAGIFVSNFLIGRVIRWLVGKGRSKSDPLVRLLVNSLFWPIALCVFALGMRFSFRQLTFFDRDNVLAHSISRFFIILSVIWAVFSLGKAMCRYGERRARQSNNRMGVLLMILARRALNVIVAAIFLLFILQNLLGVNINAILASAGVAGLAIAFAAQSTIANFFGSVMILLDHPFTVGDRVRIGEVDGSVETVGFRSTRVRSLDGNLYTIPNHTVADSVVENVTERPFIKTAFSVGLTYDTDDDAMRKARELLEEIIGEHPGFNSEENPPLIRFTEFRDWSLNISVTLWFEPADWRLYQSELEQVNLKILKRFNAAGLNFAFPTSTNYLVEQRPQDTLQG